MRVSMKGRNLGFLILAVVMICGVCFAGGALWNRSNVPNAEVTSDLISERLGMIAELASVEYMYTNMGKFEETTDFYGWKVPFTKKSFIIAYDGKVKAGLNLKETKVAVRGKKIEIQLPPAKILSHSIADNSIEVFDETKNIFKPITITDYTRFYAGEKTKIEEKAIGNGLLAEADKKAKEAVQNFFGAADVFEREYEIVFK